MVSTGSAQRRVVITGMGLISPLGNNPAALWSAIEEGRSGIGPLRSIAGEALPVRFGGEAWDFGGDAEDFGTLDKQTTRTIKKALKVMCREIVMGVAAAQLALADSQLAADQRDPDRTGVVYASDYIMTTPGELAAGIQACVDEQGEFQFARWATDGLTKVDPLWLLKFLPNMPASHIAILNDLRGPNNSVTVREAGANLAIAEAYCTIERGHADVMLAGATGTRIHPVRTVHVALQETLAQGDDPHTLSRPFDRRRTGMVLGEGAGALVLEELSHAQRRGAKIWGEITGYGSSTVFHLNGADGRSQALSNSLSDALRTAGRTPDRLGHVHAHGLSTVDADIAEAQAIAEVLGPARVPVTSGKSYFGNLGAGSGLVEVITSVLALAHQQPIPLLNFEEADAACPVEVMTRETAGPGDSFVNLNVSPQGQASAVLVEQFAG